MKKLFSILFLFSAIISFSTGIKAFPAKIVSGQLFIGGSSFGTPGYQTYLRFELFAESRMPKRDYILTGEQINSVYLDHPIQPKGIYDYKVGMPFHGSAFYINSVLFAPVWYADCVWRINSSIETPTGSVNSPQFVIVSAPFTMTGTSEFYGAYSTGFRIRGQGTSELKFEKMGAKYYLLEARYLFTDNTLLNTNSK